MSKSLIAGLAVAAGILMTGALVGSASAMPAVGVSHPYAGAVQRVDPRRIERFENHERHEHFEHRRHYSRGPVLFLDAGNGGCYWLKRRALNTGSRYWWHRYQECREG